MSSGISKKKGKRSRSRSSEVNTSFVKNVTSKVTGLLPAITKWFSSPNSTGANGSLPPAESDSSSDEEVVEPIVSQPAAKRMRYDSPGKFSHYSPSEVNCISVSSVEQSEPYDITQPSTSKSNFRGETYVSLRSAKEASVMDRNDNASFKFLPTTPGGSGTLKRKSLFNSTSSNEDSIKACAKTSCNTIRDPREPCFKPSLLGSPFYPGRTMYGGAASSYINQPNIKQRKVALVNTTSNIEENSISHSARKMLELLESYSSPLAEARRIPVYTKNTSKDSSNTSFDQSMLNTSKTRSYKTQELHVPSIASILQLKKKSRLMDTTKVARQLIASHSSAADHLAYKPVQRGRSETDSSNKLTTKVKSRLKRTRGNSDMDVMAEPAPELNFTAVLNIDRSNLPNFNLDTPSAPKSILTSTPLPQAADTKKIQAPEAAPRSTETIPSSSLKFSSPERLTSAVSLGNMSTPSFSFGSPDRSIDKLAKKEENEPIPSIFINTSKEAAIKVSKSKDWQCPDCWVNNKPDIVKCVCCGAKQPSKDIVKATKCSNCKTSDCMPQSDKCGDCLKVNHVSKPANKPLDSLQWKCEDCWVTNEDSVNKCLCCGGAKPSTNSAPKAKPVADTNNLDAEWKCDVCWIKNKNNVDKCIACGDSRPGTKSAATLPLTNNFSSAFKPSDQEMTNIIKSQTEKWECTSCLVRNDSEKTKCACCETEKQGSKKSETKSFNFGMNANTSFKFGIAAASQETVKKPEETKPKVEESETNNNVLEKTPTFTFTLPTKKAKDEIDNIKDKIEAPKINFTFGVPESVSTPVKSTVPPTFGTPKKAESEPKPATVDDEKPQEVPKVDFSLLAEQSTAKPLAMFNAPLTNSHKTDKPLGTLLSTPITKTEKKEALSNPPTFPSVTSSAETPKSTFTFSAIKPSTNIFASPVSNAVTTASFASSVPSVPTAKAPSVFAKSEPSATASLPMFANPESKASPSLFQKSEPVSTPAATMSAPAPIFSFGSNAPSIAATTEPPKPKFNFTFGSNTKTDAPSMFNISSFGESTDNNGPKFSLPSTNPLINNALSVPLGGVNGSMTGSALPGSAPTVTNPANNAASATQPAGGLFGAPQKENMWPATNNTTNNLFASNSAMGAQKPAAFTFGSTPSPFNASATPAFGAASQNIFGANGTNQNLFSSPPPSQPAAPMFGSSQPNNPTAPMGARMYGAPGGPSVPAFGSPNPAMPTFETSSATPAAAPSFNFGASQTAAPVFGFGQQQMSQPSPQPVYSFGSAPVAGQVQFNMGSVPNTNVRRVRKAVRRTQPR